jgi:hypothetical protein
MAGMTGSFEPRRSSAQEARPSPVVCQPAALRAAKSLPQLRYKCRPGLEEYDEAILKWPARVKALNTITVQLATFTDPSWWQTDVNALNTCDFKKRIGQLSEEESQQFKDDYSRRLIGDRRLRLVIVFDPCYQTEYGGSTVFLLSRTGSKVFVSKVLDGYFSRVENSIGFDYAYLKGEKIIEIETASSFPPSLTNYYFAIDQKTNQARPRMLFLDGKPSNIISSAMLMNGPDDLEQPEDATELEVIRDHKLAPSFFIYTEDADGQIKSEGRDFTRTIYNWHGRYYLPAK